MSARSGTKYIFVTGGVLSGLGKGHLGGQPSEPCWSRGASRVTFLKLDPYLNVDPGHHEPHPARGGVSSPTTAPRPTSTSGTTSATRTRAWGRSTT